MKIIAHRILLLIFYFWVSAVTHAQLSDNTYELWLLKSYLSKDESVRKIKKYHESKYINNDDKLASGVLLAQVYESKFDYKAANKVLQRLEEMQAKNPTPTAWLLALHFARNDYAKQAQKVLESVSKTNISTEMRLYVQCFVDYGLGKYGSTLNLIAQIESAFLQQAIGMLPAQYAFFQNPGINKKWLISRYVELCMLKVHALKNSYQINEAIAQVESALEFAKKYLPNQIEYQSELQTLLAEVLCANEQFPKAQKAYLKAYTLLEDLPREDPKVFGALLNVIKINLLAGNKLEAANYHRRLQMQAIQFVGNNDPLQFCYDVASFFMAIYTRDFERAARVTLETAKKYTYLPPNSAPAKLLLDIYQEYYLYDAKGGRLLAEVIKRKMKVDSSAYGPHSSRYIGQLLTYHNTIKATPVTELTYKNLSDAIVAKIPYPLLKHDSIQNAYAIAPKWTPFLFSSAKYDTAYHLQNKYVLWLKSKMDNTHIYYLTQHLWLVRLAYLSGNFTQGKEALEQHLELLSKHGFHYLSTTELAYLHLLFEFARQTGNVTLMQKSTLIMQDFEAYTHKPLYFTDEYASAVCQANMYFQTGNFYLSEKKLLKLTPYNTQIQDYNLHKMAELLTLDLQLQNGKYNGLLNKIDNLKERNVTNLLFAMDVMLLKYKYFISINDFKNAQAYLNEFELLISQKFNKNHYYYSQWLLMKAQLTAITEKNKEKEIAKWYETALTNAENALGATSNMYFEMAVSAIHFYISSKQLATAELYIRKLAQALENPKNDAGFKNAKLDFLKAKVAYEYGKYEQAEAGFDKTAQSLKSIFNTQHPEYLECKSHQSKALYMAKKADEALAVMQDIVPKYYQYVMNVFPNLSFQQKAKFWSFFKQELDYFTYLVVNRKKTDDFEAIIQLANIHMLTKGILLNAETKIRQSIQNSNDSTLINNFQSWVDNRQQLAYAYNLSDDELKSQGIDIAKLESKQEKLERWLSSKSEEFSKQKWDKSLSIKNIYKYLLPNEYAIDIIRYRKFNKYITDSAAYAFIVINKDNLIKPTLINLPNGNELENKYFKSYRNYIKSAMTDIYSYDYFLAPVAKMIPKNATIYVSSDGVYSQINLETLYNSASQTYAIEQFNFVYIQNLKDLFNNSAYKNQTYETYLFGNPAYYVKNATSNAPLIPNLEGAKGEVQLLTEVLNPKISTLKTYYGTEITESRVKSIVSPFIVHFATHGYFKETKNAPSDAAGLSPMVQSGLLVSGGGDILEFGYESDVITQEGILTAMEISEMNLNKTLLVVLSACETGRGDIQAGEGVMGMQRAFAIAGAKNIILSHFKVDDEVTKLLMKDFYGKLLEIGDVRKAFAEAKRNVMIKYPNPKHWGSFALVENSPKSGYNVPK